VEKIGEREEGSTRITEVGTGAVVADAVRGSVVGCPGTLVGGDALCKTKRH